MPVVKKDVESLFVEVARAAIGNNHVYPTFQKSQRGADGKDIFIYPAVVYYVTGSESVQTLKNQHDFSKTVRYEVRAESYGETVGLDRDIRQRLDDANRLISSQGVFDDPSDQNPLAGPSRGLYRRFRTVEIRV